MTESEHIVNGLSLTVDEQQTVTNLRKRTLLLWITITQQKRQTLAKLYENTSLKGQLTATDVMETKFSFDDWESPMGTYDHVVIRGTDVQYLDIEMN
ncbi:3297_t:CDS:2 [Paraglomus occultum]|uniref:3297_t:CDS:1 n=1 Tax=Paraglomus occultum TaxID=144539 RepID=A0A9N9E248_9GLOM|nr:3297_t:CDS:2 [Paraglomus occultum]